ncbi:hypothetical protein NECAME_12218 [Necator americanus]|uniref:Uncharacterized protein n=1 Tax=Necator americanus TaxID=51031 RepID=W2T0W4_NECAM|nr:hypothetical protein NECAME_12218 [Necator americanus]ETN75645.1 hypothetical protein NECAME_12218 [Necator americanus]
MEEMSSLLIVEGGVFLPTFWAMLALIFFVFLLCQTIATPPCLFVFRYLQICKAKFIAEHYRSLRYLLIVPLFISTSTSALICLAAWPSQSEIAYFREIAINFDIQRDATFLAATLKNDEGFEDPFDYAQSRIMLVALIYLIVVMVSALTIMLYCTKRILKAARESFSEKTRKLQMQLHKTLIAQSGVKKSPHVTVEQDDGRYQGAKDASSLVLRLM